MMFLRKVAQGGALAAALLSGVACQNYPFMFQTNQRVDARDYQSQISTTDKTDILFVIDNSPSMREAIANVQLNMVNFITRLSSTTNDYQIGVITVDATRVPPSPANGTCDPCCDLDTDDDGYPDFSNCDGGRLASADGRTRILRRPTAVDPQENAEQVDEVIQTFNDILTSIGTNGDSYERSFQTLTWALGQDEETSPFAVRALNFGFLRPDADLAIIFASDEDDCTSLDPAWYTAFGRDDSQCYGSTELADPAQFVDFLVGVKNNDIRRVRAAAIVGAAPSSERLKYTARGCFTDPSGNPSDQCGCSAQRFVPDTSTPEQGDDFFCNYLASPPYSQLPTREPARENNQGGCEKMPGARYVQFMNQLDADRRAEAQNEGVYVDSLCRADYGETLEQILSNVVLNNCFTLVEPPSGDVVDNAVVIRNGERLNRVEQLTGGPSGWYYVLDNTGRTGGQICLQDIIKSVNDTYEILVVSAARGFEDTATPAP